MADSIRPLQASQPLDANTVSPETMHHTSSTIPEINVVDDDDDVLMLSESSYGGQPHLLDGETNDYVLCESYRFKNFFCVLLVSFKRC